MRAGIIDLGTNTFNIIIVNIEKGRRFKTLLNTKSAVMLGKEGINEGYLSDRAINRAYGVLRDFSQYLNDFKCEKVIAYGTSAIRAASNAHVLIDKASQLGIHISPISGDKEAELIFAGVSQAVHFEQENYLVLDIGGGSNELLIGNDSGIKWKKSFNLGGARLLDKFHPSDPIKLEELKDIEQYLDAQLLDLQKALQKHAVSKLIGSSGAFDSLASMNSYRLYNKDLHSQSISNIISLDDFHLMYTYLIGSNREERRQIPGLEELRVDTIVMASVFTNFVIKLSGVKEIIQSAYSLKEGVAANL